MPHIEAAMNYPAPREIPAGKVMLCEYRDARREDMAITETLAAKHSDRSVINRLAMVPGIDRTPA